MFKRSLKAMAAFLVATALFTASMNIPTVVDDRTELAEVALGYPFRFVIQDSSRLSIGEPDSPPFPYPVRFMSFYSSPTKVLWLPLLANYLSLYGLFLLISALRRKLEPQS